MKTITRISGVDCKIGRNSRTGSTISITVPDEDIIDVVQYFNDFKAGEEPTGKIKKIELVIYDESDMEELEKTENLQKQIEELTKQLENATTNIDEKIISSDQPLIEDVIMEQDEEVKNELFNRSRCMKCDRLPVKGNCGLQCVTNTGNVEDRDLFEDKEPLPPNQLDLRMDGDDD